MNYTQYLDYVADHFDLILRTQSQNVQPLATDDYGWVNKRYLSDSFRLAHVERYSDNKIEVLHFTTFPHKWSAEPIFGFDVICTDNQVVGAYMDMSPVLKEYPFDEGIDFQDRKPLPEWATVFSDRFILLKPKNDEEFMKFCSWALDKYSWYLQMLQDNTKLSDEEQLQVISKQNNYCEVQASNPRTFSVLKAKIGEERAKYFMQEVLFPKIK